MKPSELKKSDSKATRAEERLPFARSENADPPISFAEAKAATETVCRFHKGIIGQPGGAMDADGTVFLCPIGRQYWRYTKQTGGMFAPLRYPRGGFV
jgi:hypothetical protein